MKRMLTSGDRAQRERRYSKEWEQFVKRYKGRKHMVGNIVSARLKQSLDHVYVKLLKLYFLFY